MFFCSVSVIWKIKTLISERRRFQNRYFDDCEYSVVLTPNYRLIGWKIRFFRCLTHLLLNQELWMNWAFLWQRSVTITISSFTVLNVLCNPSKTINLVDGSITLNVSFLREKKTNKQTLHFPSIYCDRNEKENLPNWVNMFAPISLYNKIFLG